MADETTREYGYKLTTNGRKVLIACADTGGSLQITRVAFGKGLIPEGDNLADQHELIDYVADGTIADRRHENDRMKMTVQYANQEHKTTPTFYIREFMVFVINPDTNEETDLLYATLGDYPQPVPPYQPDYPGAVFQFPVTLIISDEINVSIEAPSGLVTYDELVDLQSQEYIVIPATGWEDDEDTGGMYPVHCDIAIERLTDRMVPRLDVLPDSLAVAEACRMAPCSRVMRGIFRVYAMREPTAAINASLVLLSNPPYVRSGNGGGSGDIPIASRSQLGGVIIGENVDVQEDGTISVNPGSIENAAEPVARSVLEESTATDAETEDMINDVFR